VSQILHILIVLVMTARSVTTSSIRPTCSLGGGVIIVREN